MANSSVSRTPLVSILVKQDPIIGQGSGGLAIGIDIECCDNLAAGENLRSDPFWVENFTGAEIAYCARQPEPRLSLCGLWSAKEAAIKCGQPLAGLRPIEIEIIHDDKGRPRLRLGREWPQAAANLWRVSISQSGNMCMAVCVKERLPN